MELLKRLFVAMVAAGILLPTSAPVAADEISNNFAPNLNQASLDALAKDIGAVMGGGSFHQGKALGFPLGFDLGVHVPVVGVQDDSAIVKDDGSTIQALWSQLEVGLPGRINLIGRYGKFYDGNLIGGGLRLSLLKSSVPGVPSLSVSGLYSELDHDVLKGKTFSANLALSFDVPFLHPYIGGGYDFTELDPKETAVIPGSAGQNLEGEASGYRVEAGVNLSVIPFTYLTIGGGLANGKRYYHAGAGVKF